MCLRSPSVGCLPSPLFCVVIRSSQIGRLTPGTPIVCVSLLSCMSCLWVRGSLWPGGSLLNLSAVSAGLALPLLRLRSGCACLPALPWFLPPCSLWPDLLYLPLALAAPWPGWLRSSPCVVALWFGFASPLASLWVRSCPSSPRLRLAGPFGLSSTYPPWSCARSARRLHWLPLVNGSDEALMMMMIYIHAWPGFNTV